MAEMWIKKSFFTVKIPLIAPTLGGPGPPWPPQFLLLCCGMSASAWEYYTNLVCRYQMSYIYSSLNNIHGNC